MQEVNFDGLVSPSHNYSGLAIGNLASARSGGMVSRPREAALQGLEKMQLLSKRGIPQAFLPPQLRPSLSTLRRLGFRGTDGAVLKTSFEEAPNWFAACSSASSMWTANAATVAPSRDTLDGRLHFTPANLVTNFHRSIEAAETASILKAIFSEAEYFVHHEPLPATPAFADEGAANHIRLVDGAGPGFHIFVYGSSAGDDHSGTQHFPARQTLEASRAIARLHQLPDKNVLFLRQNPKAIDAGVFHNDVISVGHENVFLYHEEAFAKQEEAIGLIISRFAGELTLIPVPENRVTLAEAVKTYLFNSQIVTRPEGGMLLLCPVECRESPGVRAFIDKQIVNGENPIAEVVFQDLRQSMRNGGGPACLRLRVEVSEKEMATLPSRIFLSDETEACLRDWIMLHYPEELTLADLASGDRYRANAAALKELRDWIGPGHCTLLGE